MQIKGRNAILLLLALGFLIIWVLEYRRTTMAERYWILLITLLFVFWYQFLNISAMKKDATSLTTQEKKEVKQKMRVKKRRKEMAIKGKLALIFFTDTEYYGAEWAHNLY